MGDAPLCYFWVHSWDLVLMGNQSLAHMLIQCLHLLFIFTPDLRIAEAEKTKVDLVVTTNSILSTSAAEPSHVKIEVKLSPKAFWRKTRRDRLYEDVDMGLRGHAI